MKKISRRTFLKGAAASAVALGMTPGLVHAEEAPMEAPEAEASEEEAIEVIGTYTADFCIVGAGIGGLSAAVQMAQLGGSVIVVEQFGFAGGGACGVEASFSINSKIQEEAGFGGQEPVEWVKIEMNYHHNRVDGTKWVNMINASGEDIDWTVENGCIYTEIERAGCVWGSEENGSFDRCFAGFIKPMYAKAVELGVKFLFNTSGKHLITNEEGAVCGLIAQQATGDFIRINAKAVQLSTGGYAQNNDYLREAGFFAAENVIRFIPGFNGDGLTMAREVGAADILHKATALQTFSLLGKPGGEYGTFGNANALVVAPRSPNTMWVNEIGQRICDEDSGKENWMALMIPSLVHKYVYSIFDQKAWEATLYGGSSAYARTARWQYDDETSLAQFNERFDTNPYNDCVKADTIEELVEKAAAQFEEMDADILKASIDRYNMFCQNGKDEDFGKDAVNLSELSTPPYYMIYMPQSIMSTYGMLATSRKFEVVDDRRNPIPGLYAAGVDACELWANIYTINVGGGTAANHIYSGRTAAKSALEYMGEATGVIETEGVCEDCVIVPSYEFPTEWKDGVYKSDAYFGMFGNVWVTATIEDGKITNVETENEMETKYIGCYALPVVAQAVVDQQTVNVDTVAGATATCTAFRMALVDCLEQAAK